MKRSTLTAGLLATALLLPLAHEPAPAMAQQHKAGAHVQLRHKRMGKRQTALPPGAAALRGRFQEPARGRFQQPGSNVRSLTPEEMSEPGPRNPYYGGI